MSDPQTVPFTMPDRIAIDAAGYGWRVWDGEEMWSMVPTNPDNSPIPEPVTWFVPMSDRPPADPLSEEERALVDNYRRLEELGGYGAQGTLACDTVVRLLAIIDRLASLVRPERIVPEGWRVEWSRHLADPDGPETPRLVPVDPDPTDGESDG